MKRPANGLQFEVREEPGVEPAFVLVHGLSSSHHIWDLVIPRLAPHRVLAYDQRGHGESDKPESGYGFEEVAEDLAALIDNAGLPSAIVAGHSWGANVALEFAARWPDRLAGLALVDGGIAYLQAQGSITWERAEEMLRPPDIDGMPVSRFLEMARGWMPVWSERVKEIVLSVFHTNGDGTISRRLPISQHMQIVRAIWEQQPEQIFPSITCPALLVPAYMDDGSVMVEWMQAKREGVREALRLMPAARAREMPDTVHDVPVHRPEELARVLKEFAEALIAAG